jgi:hypothetical protein
MNVSALNNYLAALLVSIIQPEIAKSGASERVHQLEQKEKGKTNTQP